MYTIHADQSTIVQETLNYAPICIGIVTIVSLAGWVLPFGLGGRHWFSGPKRTVDGTDSRQRDAVEDK